MGALLVRVDQRGRSIPTCLLCLYRLGKLGIRDIVEFVGCCAWNILHVASLYIKNILLCK
jgi:hypothetical protein